MILKKVMLITLTITSTIVYAQTEKDTIKINQLEEVIVVSNKVPRSKELIPIQIESVSQREIEFQNYQNTADLLANSGFTRSKITTRRRKPNHKGV